MPSYARFTLDNTLGFEQGGGSAAEAAGLCMSPMPKRSVNAPDALQKVVSPRRDRAIRSIKAPFYYGEVLNAVFE